MVFWVPRARPLQYGPANSVIAVDSNPLSSTAITEATTMHHTAAEEPMRSVNPSTIMVVAAVAAIVRTGRIRDPTRSDHRPARMRPTAPSSCETVTSAPAAPTDQWRSLSSQISMNVTVTVCGIISSADTAWIRHSMRDPR